MIDQTKALRYVVNHPARVVAACVAKGAIFGVAEGIYSAWKSSSSDSIALNNGTGPATITNPAAAQTQSTNSMILHKALRDAAIAGAFGVLGAVVLKWKSKEILALLDENKTTIESGKVELKAATDANLEKPKLKPDQAKPDNSKLAKPKTPEPMGHIFVL